MNFRHIEQHPRRAALAMALAVGLGFTGVAMGQATTGSIFGSAPSAEPGDTVTVQGANNGVSRSVTVDNNGQYTVSHLPLGTYTVTLRSDGEVVGKHANVGIVIGSGTPVNFYGGGGATELGAVTVSANSLPSIDVNSVSSSTVVTARQLEQLPIGQNAESIALLSPSAVAASGYYDGAVSFGGAGATENAYYVNGYNTTKPFNNQGGFQLPYGSIAQQKTYTGGYSAKYGRSDGGVISQSGKRGTNQWHAGAQVSWIPESLRASPKNLYYQRFKNLPDGYQPQSPELQGKLYHYRHQNVSWKTKYSMYLGGPLIRDRLYMFIAADRSKRKGTDIDTKGGRADLYQDHEKNIYAKIDWNINSSNIFELTYLKNDRTTDEGATYAFSYDTLDIGDKVKDNDTEERSAEFIIGKYTSYITDRLTFSALWGQGEFKHPVTYPSRSPLPGLSGVTDQNPAYLDPGEPYRLNNQTSFYEYLPSRGSHTRGLRADLSYRIGDHTLSAGIDNMWYDATDQGQTMTGPGYAYIYSHTT